MLETDYRYVSWYKYATVVYWMCVRIPLIRREEDY